MRLSSNLVGMRRSLAAVALALLPVLSAPALAQTTGARESAIEILFHSDSDPLKIGTNKIQVMLKEGTHHVRDADVSVVLTAPGAKKGDKSATRTVTLKHYGDGQYRGVATIPMVGAWSADITVKRGGSKIGTRTMTLEAGSKS